MSCEINQISKLTAFLAVSAVGKGVVKVKGGGVGMSGTSRERARQAALIT